jgi:hypothetical protein
MGKLKDQLAGIAALIAAIIAIGGGFAKFGEMQTKLDALSAATAPDVSGIERNSKDVAVIKKEIQLLNLQIKELKAQSSNPLGN